MKKSSGLITKVRLQNFTAFENFEASFSLGVNVLVGENGTGKTHLLKVLYSACAVTTGEDKDKNFALKLKNVFHPYEGRMSRLMRRVSTYTKGLGTLIEVERGDTKLRVNLSTNLLRPEQIVSTDESQWKSVESTAVYIPVKEMLAHAPGFIATAAAREIAFEEVYIDIIKKALLPKLKGPMQAERAKLLKVLQQSLDGKVAIKGEHFFLQNQDGDLEFTLLSEGLRKLALVWQLIQNGTLLSGSILFWDEPEANLNPALMGTVVDVILELQRLGVQVFLTTHNYVLLKEFDLRKRETDSVQYISLFRDSRLNGAVVPYTTNQYLDIHPNAIAEAFDHLYDAELSRTMNGINP